MYGTAEQMKLTSKFIRLHFPCLSSRISSYLGRPCALSPNSQKHLRKLLHSNVRHCIEKCLNNVNLVSVFYTIIVVSTRISFPEIQSRNNKSPDSLTRV
jgi:hypothetical protein